MEIDGKNLRVGDRVVKHKQTDKNKEENDKIKMRKITLREQTIERKKRGNECKTGNWKFKGGVRRQQTNGKDIQANKHMFRERSIVRKKRRRQK